MSKVFKNFPNKILVHMMTFNETHIRVLDHLLGVEKHLSVFFSDQSLSRYFTENVKPLQIIFWQA